LAYTRAIIQSGGIPLILTYDETAIPAYLNIIHGLMLSGGGDIHADFYSQSLHEKADYVFPERDIFELALVRAAIPRNIPILGICRGMQLLNVAMGGDMIQHIEGHSQSEPRPQATHSIEAWGKLAKILETTTADVNSIHHQALGRVAQGLEINAKSPDGIIEAVVAPEHPYLIAVQWHPEEMAANTPADAVQQKLFASFIKKSIEYTKTM